MIHVFKAPTKSHVFHVVHSKIYIMITALVSAYDTGNVRLIMQFAGKDKKPHVCMDTLNGRNRDTDAKLTIILYEYIFIIYRQS